MHVCYDPDKGTYCSECEQRMARLREMTSNPLIDGRVEAMGDSMVVSFGDDRFREASSWELWDGLIDLRFGVEADVREDLARLRSGDIPSVYEGLVDNIGIDETIQRVETYLAVRSVPSTPRVAADVYLPPEFAPDRIHSLEWALDAAERPDESTPIVPADPSIGIFQIQPSIVPVRPFSDYQTREEQEAIARHPAGNENIVARREAEYDTLPDPRPFMPPTTWVALDPSGDDPQPIAIVSETPFAHAWRTGGWEPMHQEKWDAYVAMYGDRQPIGFKARLRDRIRRFLGKGRHSWGR